MMMKMFFAGCMMISVSFPSLTWAHEYYWNYDENSGLPYCGKFSAKNQLIKKIPSLFCSEDIVWHKIPHSKSCDPQSIQMNLNLPARVLKALQPKDCEFEISRDLTLCEPQLEIKISNSNDLNKISSNLRQAPNRSPAIRPRLTINYNPEPAK